MGPPELRSCPRCEEVLPAGSKKCPGCGTELPSTDRPPAQFAPTLVEPGAQLAVAKGIRQSWVIGAAEDCDIVVDEATVSGHHCRLSRTHGGFILEDLGSSNGTFVNRDRIRVSTNVAKGDRITLGRTVPMPWPDATEPSKPGAGTIRIGRLAENDVVLDYPMVSGCHAQVVKDSAGTWIEDLGSTNGTSLGSPRNKIRRAKLSAGDVVYFGSLRVPASRLVSGYLAMGEQPHSSVTILGKTIVLGRGRGCDQALDDPRVSRRHAQLTRSGSRVVVEDLNWAKGTNVNGKRIRGAVVISPGDIIGLGRFTFTVTPRGDLQQRDLCGNVTVQTQGVVVEVPGKRLLDGISVTVYPGEFVGLMGPSGAGKTTLMNAMSGYTPPSAGSVLYSGRDLYANYGQFQGILGYVPQDDIMHGDLTVSQALHYTARLRLPSDLSKNEIQERVQKVIAQLGLEGAEDVLIGSSQKKGISGGQRKRVNLAMELLTDPSVLFLDEPTSGLSSEDALMVMRLLRRLADEGKTIVLTIHQPSLEAYRLLDNLILVGKDTGSPDPGRLVYYGPAYPEAVEFFNPDGVPDLAPGAQPSPDEVLRGLARHKTAKWMQAYSGSKLKREYVEDRAGRQSARSQHNGVESAPRDFGFRQWWTLVQRCLAIKVKDITNTVILLAQAPIIAILLALVFGKQAAEEVTDENWMLVANSLSITVFLLALAALWFGCSNATREIVGEWAIYHRERMVNLKIPSYVASKIAVLGGLCFVQCAVLLGIVYFAAGLQGPLLAMFVLVLLTSLVGLAIGLTVSALARTSEAAIAMLPLILIPMVILAGVLQPVYKMNSIARVLANVMPSRWAFEGLLLMEVQDRPMWTPPAVPELPPAAAQKQVPPNPSATPDGQAESACEARATPPTRRLASAPDVTQQDEDEDAAKSDAEEDSADTTDKEPKELDMAEKCFPKETERMGPGASTTALAGMLVLLVVAVHGILKSRDVH